MWYDFLKKGAKIGEERGKTYGKIEDNFIKTSKILKVMFGIELKPSQIVEVLIAVKFARNLFMEKEDNTIDAINYLAIRKSLIDKGL